MFNILVLLETTKVEGSAGKVTSEGVRKEAFFFQNVPIVSAAADRWVIYIGYLFLTSVFRLPEPRDGILVVAKALFPVKANFVCNCTCD